MLCEHLPLSERHLIHAGQYGAIAKLEHIGNIMVISYGIAAVSAVLMSSSFASPAAPTPTAAQNMEQILAEGPWTGKFLQRDWTFEFKNEGGGWSGKYMRSDGKSWLPLNDLVVSERSVSFSIESTPKVSFSLSIDAENQNMAGTATIDGVATVPFSAARKP